MLKRRKNGNVLELYDENNSTVLSIEEYIRDGVFYIALCGQLKNNVAHDFEDELMAALTVCSRVVVNLERVDYIASMSMKALLSVRQILDELEGTNLTLTKVSGDVLKTLSDCGFTDMLQIEEQTTR